MDAQRQAAEATRIENAKAELRLSGMPRLEVEIERQRASLEVERNSRVGAEQAAAVAAARLEKSEAEVSDLKSRLAKAETDGRDAWQESHKLRHRMKVLETSLEAALKDVAQFKDAAFRGEESAANLRGQLLELRNNHQAVQFRSEEAPE
jgi:soluble cytochrome b562